MADINAALVKQILDVPRWKRTPDMKHDRQTDDFLAGLEILEWIACRHASMRMAAPTLPQPRFL
jgi:hypothetical protein